MLGFLFLSKSLCFPAHLLEISDLKEVQIQLHVRAFVITDALALLTLKATLQPGMYVCKFSCKQFFLSPNDMTVNQQKRISGTSLSPFLICTIELL